MFLVSNVSCLIFPLSVFKKYIIPLRVVWLLYMGKSQEHCKLQNIITQTTLSFFHFSFFTMLQILHLTACCQIKPG